MPLPTGARVGTLPDGSLTWIDASGQPINADGSPMSGSQTATPLAPTPAAQTTTPASAAQGSSAVQVPASTNIDANAGAPPAAAAATAPGTTQPQGPPVAGVGTPGQLTPGQPGPTPVPGMPGGNYTVDQLTGQQRQEITDANAQVQEAYTAYQKLQTDYAAETDPLKQQQLSAQLQGAYGQLSTAEQRVATANAAYSSTLTQALKTTTVDPAQANVYNAQAGAADAQGKLSDANAKVLLDGADTQKELVAANAGLASANATNAIATAAATTAKTPAEKAALESQASLSKAQADQINTLLPGLVDKQKADTTLTISQAGLTDANSDLAKANTAKVGADTALVQAQTDYQKATTTGLLPAQVTETQARGVSEAATAQATLEATKQKQLGPLYGLQDQINAIHSIAGQVFGPGGTGNPSHADDLLQQYVDATIGGTTPYAASVAAQNAQQNIFGTQAAMQNQQVQAAASRANQYAGLAGTTLGTLEQMNQYAPKGSTAMAGAFRGVMDEMAQRLQAPQFQAPPTPQAPDLPTFLQGFTAGHRAATATAATAVQSATGGGQTGGTATPTINVNVNGQPAPGGAAAPAAAAPGVTSSTIPGLNVGAFPGAGPGPVLQSTPQINQATPPTVNPVSNATQTPSEAFSQGLASNAPQLPNYLSSLVNPMSMLSSGFNLMNANRGPTAGMPGGAFTY
jgi:hypothetical protein